MDMMKPLFAASVLLAAAGAAAQATAPVTVATPWARATVQGQRASGAFMTIVPTEPLTLVGASSPIAGVAEVHEMKMEGDVMRMRAVTSVALPANQPFQLKPGGYHLMLQELKAPLAPNTSIPVTLNFRTAKGEARQLTVQVPVSALPPKEAGVMGAEPHKH